MKKLKNKFLSSLILILVSTVFFKCGISPEPINYGKDECENCRMLIIDDRYGSEVLTDKGKVYKFDSIECLVEYALDKNLLGDDNKRFLVNDFSQPKKLIDVKKAFYVHNETFRSPMGLNVSAFEKESAAKKFISENGGSKLVWIDVIDRVKLL
jgi:copper chaperone NosL